MTNLSVFTFESYSVRFVGTAENPEWVAQDVCVVLGIKRTSDAIGNFDDDEKGVKTIKTSGGSQKVLTVTLKGLKRLVAKSRKPIAKQIAAQIGFEVFVSCKEADTIETIQKAFKHFKPISQFFVNGFFIDLYFPNQRLAVECDESHHRGQPSDWQRQDAIAKALGCRFIRFNPDKPGFNVGDVINQIMLTIDEEIQ